MVNLADDLPKVDSFIIPKDDQFNFISSLSDDVSALSHVESEATEHGSVANDAILSVHKPKRLKRWLKNQDRNMVKIILELQKSDNISHEEIVRDVAHSDESKHIWTIIKNKLDTDRSIEFLQCRYHKLTSNQRLNSKEMILLSDKYDKVSVDEFMVIFPGKTRDTLQTLVNKMSVKDQETLNKAEKLTKIIDGVHPEYTLELGKPPYLIY
jgi:hypothetical protein